MKTENFEKVITLLEKSGCDIDFKYHLKDNDFSTADEVREILEDANAFDQEVIYYSRAMEYLTEHDTSLRKSLEIAQDMGYEPKNLSSEILASLLSSQVEREQFSEIFSELEDLLIEISEQEQQETEEEEK